MLPITKAYLTNQNRPALRNRQFYSIRKLKGIVAHWTANPGWGANARANRNYFNTTPRKASAHYIVDDRSIIQCLPDSEVGYHVGARRYKPIGMEIKEGNLTPNFFTIGFEMCVNMDGDWDKTYQNSVELAQYLLNKYNFTVNDLYRHYDITGKLCPRMMIEEKDWQAFKQDVNAGLEFQIEHPVKQGKINVNGLNVRRGPGIQYGILKTLNQDDEVEIFEQIGNWYRIEDNNWVHKHYVEITFTQQQGIVDDPTELNVRSGPGMQFPVVEKLPNGTHVVVEDKEGNWYQIGDNKYVYYRLVKIVEIKTGKVVNANFLNVRKGPSTRFSIVKKLQNGALVKILETEGRWLRVSAEEWVHGAYIEIIE
ncbi:MAG: SH3 domain-containing protein [Bacteroidota bacterium]